MANFVAVLDPDPARRAAFAAAAAERVAPLPGLRLGRADQGELAVVWAAGPRAPVSTTSGPAGLGLLFGDAIPGPGPERLDAAGLLDQWHGRGTAAPPAYDGYHAALAHTVTAGLRLGGDVMGMYPLYWWHDGTVTLVGSSAALFRLHPRFRYELDPRGLAGILCLNGLVANRTLYHGVHRLPPGRVLQVRPGEAPAEIHQYAIPDSREYHDTAFTVHLELLEETLSGVIARHLPAGSATGLMLSGGLDSRMLAGFLQRRGAPVTALTLGIPRDMEAQCAARVARAAGFRHLLQPDEVADPVGAARINARWEHLSPGFFGATGWSLPGRLHGLPDRFVAGYALDALMSPKRPGVRPEQDAAAVFDALFARGHRWGVPAEQINDLVGDPRAVDQVREELREELLARSPRLAQCRWRHILGNRSRLHLGSTAWRMSFGAWPVYPVLDRALHALVAGLPPATIGERRAETELVRTRFPHLARLPLDRNAENTTPIEPTTFYLIREGLTRRLAPALGPIRRLRRPMERRYYYRTADFNGPTWRMLRRAADTIRDAVAPYVDRAAFDRALPPASADVHVKDGISDAAGYKLLIGLAFWAADQAEG